MRIAQVAPLAESVPPKLYGGTERVISWLTEELVSLGHEVTTSNPCAASANVSSSAAVAGPFAFGLGASAGLAVPGGTVSHHPAWPPRPPKH
jgi:hypothetical protein